MVRKSFYGTWVVAAAFVTFGIAVGLPYYNMPFFYDYYQKTFGWSRSAITLGFPLAALLTLWVGPVLIPRLSPRKSIVIGTGLTLLAFTGFSRMSGDLTFYYFCWFLYTVGYILSGPIPHQVIVSHWFSRNRGTAMAIVYVGVGAVASLGSLLVKAVTRASNFHTALMAVGAMMLLAWPIALFVIRDKPAEKGQFPDGAAEPPPLANIQPRSFGYLLGKLPFWLLLIGSFCSIGSIGALNFHMKFVFEDQGFKLQALRDAVWADANVIILCSSIAGRLIIGFLADRLSMKWIMFATYFIVAATIPLLLMVAPPGTPWLFAIMFGFAMGADYMLIPLMAARQFGLNTLARAMAVILPVNTIGQTWFPYFVSILRSHAPDYMMPMYVVFGVAMLGAVAIAMLPSISQEESMALNDAARTAAKG